MSETILNNRYRLVAQQGSGGMSVVYRAMDVELGRNVAVKILRPSLTTDPTFLERFRNEARAVAKLSHPNIVTVYDVRQDGPTHYIVMELVEGTDLKRIIRDFGVLPVDRALNFAIQICAGIGFSHRSGLVHADIKPQNILITKEDVVKITDFGIAQALSDTQPGQRQDMVWGSPHYFAPEQARGEKPSPASDVYAIGIVMFEMLTGRLPYGGATQRDLALAHIQQPIPLVSDINPAVPEKLAQIVYKIMSKEPSARYSMADQLGHVLISYRDRAKDVTVGSPSEPAPSSAPTVARQPIIPAPPSVSSNPTIPPAPPFSSEPTVRYGAAPIAPSDNPFITKPPSSSPSTFPVSPSQPFQQRHTIPQPARGDSGQFYSASLNIQDNADREGFDWVTLALAFLAFMAVACLIPLYIAVWAARAV